ncbi:MarR family winged helix-turn-helix transcriptional regulator [Vineibacter terrae]|nr:MarR family transcriptional regulator [Vineibacter terrae]
MKRQATVKSGEAGSGIDGRSDAGQRHDLNNRLFFRLFQAANIYEAQAVRQLNLSAVQGATLGALSRDANGMPFSDLYTYLSVSRQNLDAVLKRLEQAGLVERLEGKTDRRQRVVRLTPAGVDAWADIRQRTIDFYRQGTKGLSAEEVSTCAEMLSRIGRALKTMQLK